jgi:hypothetical protein
MTDLQHKRKQRRKITGEDFTPTSLVLEMLAKLPEEIWQDPNKTFLDNSAGNGNFLIEILRKKLVYGHPTIQALSTIYGTELMDDNVEEMKERLFSILPSLSQEDTEKAKQILNTNIICTDAFKWNYENWKPLELNSKIKPLF